MTQQQIIASLPAHLRSFVKTQDYARYTPQDQAVWRFIMTHLTRQLRDTAHPVYMEGLRRTGLGEVFLELTGHELDDDATPQAVPAASKHHGGERR